MEIKIKTIPHEEQRYDTVGDWWLDGDGIEVRVSDLGNKEFEALVGVHEVVEALLCRNRGIDEEDVSDFDMSFETMRARGFYSATEEPGDNSRAPYHKEHCFATKIEKLLAKQLKVSWDRYSNKIESL